MEMPLSFNFVVDEGAHLKNTKSKVAFCFGPSEITTSAAQVRKKENDCSQQEGCADVVARSLCLLGWVQIFLLLVVTVATPCLFVHTHFLHIFSLCSIPPLLLSSCSLQIDVSFFFNDFQPLRSGVLNFVSVYFLSLTFFFFSHKYR